ncbi:MAG: hypothetical protein JWN15_1205, partial [Firmicutes bacterium]|nr:hypothetical protein [Bacillota bacterium]
MQTSHLSKTACDPLGAALHNLAGTVNVKNSFIATTTDGNGNARSNCAGAITNLGGNMSTDSTCPGLTQVTRAHFNLGPLQINLPGTILGQFDRVGVQKLRDESGGTTL